MHLKVIQVYSRYYPHLGGVEDHVKNISERFVRRFDVTVCTTDPSGMLPKDEVINGVEVRRFRSWAPNEAYYFSRELKRYLLENSGKFDVVHAHDYHALPALYAAQAKRRNALIFTPHYLGGGQTFFRNLLHIPYKFIARKLFELSDRVICVSKYEKNLIMSKFKPADEKVIVIPNGVNMVELSEYKWAPNLSRPRITYAGRLERYQKNLDRLIRSFEILTREYRVDAELVIIGSGTYEKGMRRLLLGLGLEDRVTLTGWLPRRQYLEKLSSSSIFVMPSECECYGISVAEAIMLGVPTVVSKSTALGEFVEGGLALGIDVPITPRTIASAVYEVLTRGFTKSSVPSRVILSWDDVASQLEQLYLQVRVAVQ